MKTNAHLSDQVTESERNHQLLALEAAGEGIVLLRNNGVLPLSPCPLALYGAGARYTVKGGSGSGEVNVRQTITVEQGLQHAGFAIVSNDWLLRYDRRWKARKEDFLKGMRRNLWWPSAKVMGSIMSQEYIYPAGDRLTDAEAIGCGADTCIYVLSRQSGEGHDMTDTEGSFRLCDTERHNIRLCAARFTRFVLVINTGSPIDLSPLDEMEGIDAIVYMSQLGMMGGEALADVLSGRVTPSGHLAVSWPQRYADVPFGEEFAADLDRAEYKEGIYVGYRYYDSFDVAPRYPFGYGLSYTDFAIGATTVSLNGEQVTCSVQVTNTGSQFAGKQVVQLYVRCPGRDREYRRLAAFAKTDLLQPGQKQALWIMFPLSVLSRYEEQDATTVLEEGRYVVCAGVSSRDNSPVAVIRVAETIVLSRHKNLCTSAAKVSVLQHTNMPDIPAKLPVLEVDSQAFVTRVMDYSVVHDTLSPSALEKMEGLTVDDFAVLCTGTGMSGEKRGFRTPGAVGHTTTDYLERGIPNAEICDAPAGIRLEKRAVQYPNGDIWAVDVSLSVYEFFPKLLLRMFVLGDPNKGQMLYQFVTGFPAEAAVAHTWNLPLVERIGRAVSTEMSEYGVRFWLAPAMNIVRNPLCGRNYEYYSEDPLLTGLLAAAVTRGVQAAPGNYVTLKHYCGNNQETNRFFVSSDMDERVLREIYCRGFEIAVTTSQPRAVMAAYNKVNGVYCPESRELCTDLLRCEWGFDGVVMTDWFSTDQDRANPVLAIRAGVDMNMPGGKKIVSQLKQACRNGELSASELRLAAARVVSAIVGEN